MSFLKSKILVLILLALPFMSNSQNIVITEIMYNHQGNDTLEFIEIYNNSGTNVNLNGFYFDEGIQYTFGDTVIANGSYFVLAKDTYFFNEFFGKSAIAWTEGDLDNKSEKIVLKNASGVIVDSVEYEDEQPWTTDADGVGSSLVLCDPSSNNALGYNWDASANFYGLFLGTPINATPYDDESGCSAPGDIYPPKITKVFESSPTTVLVTFNETVGASGENISNYTGLGTITSAVKNGTGETVTLTLATPLTLGTHYTLTVQNVSDQLNHIMVTTTKKVVFNNSIGDLVITEIMYNNPGRDTLQYLEVYNRGTEVINLGGYKFTDGISFTFPAQTLNADSYLLVVRNQQMVNTFYNITNTLQWESGGLDNDGERITIKNTIGDIIDSLTFKDDWHFFSDGMGSSLVRCNKDEEGHIAGNWGRSENFKGTYENTSIFGTPLEGDVTCISGVQKSEEFNSFQIVPNPSQGKFDIRFNLEIKNSTYELFNASGVLTNLKPVYTSSNSAGFETSLNKGIYFLRISKEDGTYSIEKIVIE